MAYTRNHSAGAPHSATGLPFVFGRGLFRRDKTYTWDPDTEPNPHLLIWGGSGAGKTRLLRQIIAYLQQAGKHLHVLDLHGDLACDGENAMAFGGTKRLYGINPFEFDRAENGGPAAQAHEMIGIFRKTYLSSMGAVQEMVLRQLILDTYRSKGIDPNRPATWLATAGAIDLPTLEDMKDLIDYLNESLDTGLAEFAALTRRYGKQLDNWRSEQTTLLHQNARFRSSGNEQAAARNNAASASLRKTIEDSMGELTGFFRQYMEYAYLGGAEPDFMQSMRNDGEFPVDLNFYRRKPARRVLESLNLYVAALLEHGVFNTTPPPVRAGLNRYDLSALPDEAKTFFADVLAAKVFRAVRLRGEYRLLPNKPRGRAVDTYIVLDECQIVLPANPKERESPRQVLNRIAAEARKYGLGLIVVSQSPTVFPRVFFSNVAQKVGLRTNANDAPPAMRYLGVADKALFQHVQKNGIAMVSNRSGGFDSVQLAWD